MKTEEQKEIPGLGADLNVQFAFTQGETVTELVIVSVIQYILYQSYH